MRIKIHAATANETSLLRSMTTHVRTLSRRLAATWSAKLGRCSRCIQLSMRSAALGWLAVVPAHLLWPNTRFWLLEAWTLSFTSLWLLHIIAFGWRSAAVMGTRARTVVAPDPNADGRVSNPVGVGFVPAGVVARRQAIGAFFTSAGLALLTSLLQPLVRTQPMQNCIWPGSQCLPGGVPCCPGFNCCGGICDYPGCRG